MHFRELKQSQDSQTACLDQLKLDKSRLEFKVMEVQKSNETKILHLQT